MSNRCAKRRGVLAAGAFDVALFTTAIQIVHLARVARELGIEDAALDNLRQCQVCSIGPTTTEALEEFGSPSHDGALPPEDGLSGKRSSGARDAVDWTCGEETLAGDGGRIHVAGFPAARLARLIGYVLGYLLDKEFGTTWLYIPGLILGIAAGFVQLIRQLMRDTRDDG